MKLDELLEKFPAAKTYFEHMPSELLERYTIQAQAVRVLVTTIISVLATVIVITNLFITFPQKKALQTVIL